MNFFRDNAHRFSFFETENPGHGLRRGQVGALHALAAHFCSEIDPAVVSLPTGYGKTAVMTGACFTLRAGRVLVIVPTAALRNQAVRAFRSLDVLVKHGTFQPERELLPIVTAIDGRMSSVEGWLALEASDVVVATPHSTSPEIAEIVGPPEGFFDLVLMDEGHHSPAKTWEAFIRSLPRARHALFTATPYRLDGVKLPGRLVFYYPLKRAVEENAFGKVNFDPVAVPQYASREEIDAALVERAVQVFARDRDAGREHRLLIRCGRIDDAVRLARQYTAAGLRVESASSRLSPKAVESIEERLRNGALDGIVCVDMFGEGYDFPQFKIAVLHEAHRSLVPTLQFIGRFARTNGVRTGEATFIAAPQEINSESDELYKSGVQWDLLIANVADARQQLSLVAEETLRGFSESTQPSADYDSVELRHFLLPQHIAAYVARQVPAGANEITKIGALEVVKSWETQEHDAFLFLVRELNAPIWSRGRDIIDARHDLFFVKYFPDTQLLFITATQRKERLYSSLIEQIVGGNASPMPFAKVRNVLNGLEQQEFFSIGLRNTSPVATTESYRIVAGSQADRGVRDTDGAVYCQGHFFGRGEVDGESEIIGASSGGRVWSNGKIPLSDLLDWMNTLHARISAAVVAIGRSGLDRLPFGEALTNIPADTVAGDWSRDTYRGNPTAILGSDAGRRSSALDLSITDIRVNADQQSLQFSVGDDMLSRRLVFTPHRSPRYSALADEPGIYVESRDGNRITIEEWLDEEPITFYTAQLNTFTGTTLNRRTQSPGASPGALRVIDWQNCDIRVEFDLRNDQRRTVQRHFQEHLLAQRGIDFVVYDHRSGEAADFVVGGRAPDGRYDVSLFHCKGAGGAHASGERVDDVYELVGQAVKSVRYQILDELVRHLERRTVANRSGGVSPLLLGNRDQTLSTLKSLQPIDLRLTIACVQPGLSAAALDPRLRMIMAAANDSVAAQQGTLIWYVGA
ncbi:DEAD/DEAH box helicase family protein [Paraburkholderia sediminicola]|uniref:DEAD/DEAH box helicase n=1 Tax=Paraburkholderia sediminicola TaxID=458836 RepID=UPI0038BDFEE3